MANTVALMKPGAATQWETPEATFGPLHAEFNFILDVAASHTNAKAPYYWTEADDALVQPWARLAGVRDRLYECAAWMNPPYGRGVGRWLTKAAEERLMGLTTVCLLPARTDTRWWHEHVWDGTAHHPRTGVGIRFLQGRVRFELGGKPAPAGSTFPSVIVVFQRDRA